ncbi:MAG: 50S ribosomal protein L3 [Candidatus Woesearchaeota archaeon]
MANIRSPRRGSMQFYPRKRAKSIIPRINHKVITAGFDEFAGYKAGMTQLMVTDNGTNSMTKGEEIVMPVTVIECPPMKVMGIRLYKNNIAVGQMNAEQLNKHLDKRIRMPKAKQKEQTKDFDFLRLLVHTQPYLTTIGQKAPDVFEVSMGAGKEEQLKRANELLGKEIIINNVFNEGEQLDIHSITKGKGYQGPVKRFGIGLRSHKSEKTKRGPGSLGGWSAQGHVMYRVAHAGQMGFHQRTEYNKWLLKIGTEPKKINPKGGFLHYGIIKNNYVLVKGSIGGPAKRLIIMTKAIRPRKQTPKEAPSIEYISLESKQ